MALVGCDLESKDFTLFAQKLFDLEIENETGKDTHTTRTSTGAGLRGDTQASST